MALLQTEAIAIKGKDLGEADRMITFFTRRAGKLRVVANGVRRTRSRMSALVQPFTHSSIVVYQGGSIPRLRNGEIIDSNLVLRENLLFMAASTYLTELVDFLTEEEDAQESVFVLLLNTLQVFKEKGVAPIFLRNFELRLISMLGFRPNLDRCVECDGEISSTGKTVNFSVEQGGIKCVNCKDGEDREISGGSLKVMKRLLETPWRQLYNLQIDSRMGKELESLFQEYIEFRTEKRLKSLGFLRSIMVES